LFLFDANVLIYAFRRDSPHHAPCHAWLGAALAGDEPVATTSIVELALLRISTLPSLGSSAAKPSDVFRFLDAVRARPVALRVEPGGGIHGFCSAVRGAAAARLAATARSGGARDRVRRDTRER
jgi:predicted nucleic acid-binding protein